MSDEKFYEKYTKTVDTSPEVFDKIMQEHGNSYEAVVEKYGKELLENKLFRLFLHQLSADNYQKDWKETCEKFECPANFMIYWISAILERIEKEKNINAIIPAKPTSLYHDRTKPQEATESILVGEYTITSTSEKGGIIVHDTEGKVVFESTKEQKKEWSINVV